MYAIIYQTARRALLLERLTKSPAWRRAELTTCCRLMAAWMDVVTAE